MDSRVKYILVSFSYVIYISLLVVKESFMSVSEESSQGFIQKRSYLPVMLDVTRMKIVLIGAGKACAEKLRSLEQAGKNITVIAPEVDPVFENKDWIHLIRRKYEHDDLKGAGLAYVGINDPGVQKMILEDALHHHVLINFVDKVEDSQFISPSLLQRDHFSIFISTFGRGPGAVKKIRQTIEKELDLDALDAMTGEYVKHRKHKKKR